MVVLEKEGIEIIVIEMWCEGMGLVGVSSLYDGYSVEGPTEKDDGVSVYI
jgi:hypothetical protein